MEVPLKEYLESRITSLEKATTIAASNLEKRLEGMNEFRAQLKDQSNSFFTKAEHDYFAAKIESDLRVLRESKAMLEGKASQNSVTVSLIISIIGILLGAIGLVHSLFP